MNWKWIIFLFFLLFLFVLWNFEINLKKEKIEYSYNLQQSKWKKWHGYDTKYYPDEYQKILGVGIDVDWVKSNKIWKKYTYEVAEDFKKRGFSHLRIRLRDKIDDEILNRLETVVQDSLIVGLVPIIAYQADEFKKNPNCENLQKTIKEWEKIANRFKNYNPELSFDLLIEVTDELNQRPEMLNKFYSEVLRVIRKSNPYRIIFVSPVVRSAPENLKLLNFPQLKTDKFLMAEFHFYASGPDKENPKKVWTTGTEREKDLIRNKIKIAKEWEKETGIKTWVGAWMAGNYNKGNDYSIKEQIEFAKFVSQELKKNKIPFAINSGKWFYDYDKKEWKEKMKKILDVILK